MADSATEGKGIIAERLDRLFETVQPEGRPFRLREVAEGVNEQAGASLVSVQYLSQLRNGDRRKPSHEVLSALSKWFGVPVTYFSDDETARRTDDELRVLKLMKDAKVRNLAFRAEGMSEESLSLVTELIERLRRADGLPGDSGGPDIGWHDPAHPDS